MKLTYVICGREDGMLLDYEATRNAGNILPITAHIISIETNDIRAAEAWWYTSEWKGLLDIISETAVKCEDGRYLLMLDTKQGMFGETITEEQYNSIIV